MYFFYDKWDLQIIVESNLETYESALLTELVLHRPKARNELSRVSHKPFYTYLLIFCVEDIHQKIQSSFDFQLY
jgi:hypothetical protein